MRIRNATLSDLATLRRHREGMFRDMGKRDERQLAAADKAYAKWARARLKSGKLVGFIAVTQSGVAAASGCVWLREQQPGPAWQDATLPYFMSMYTEPEFRGKGLATKIVVAATRWCREEGFPKVVLHASTMGRGVYRRLGWERTWEMEIVPT